MSAFYLSVSLDISLSLELVCFRATHISLTDGLAAGTETGLVDFNSIITRVAMRPMDGKKTAC